MRGSISYEIHFSGDKIEMTRGPIALEGYGLRLFRRAGRHDRSGSPASRTTSRRRGYERAPRTPNGGHDTPPFPPHESRCPQATGRPAG